VVVGVHRDAWVYGALDADSGGAVMLDVIRSFTEVMKSKDWRPRRTLVFCSWGAEEYGLIGSVEFTEVSSTNQPWSLGTLNHSVCDSRFHRNINKKFSYSNSAKF
jgi:Zn-dependent M28 family amino/carboxypeptidase